MFDKYTYLDNGSITRLDERVFDEMKPYFLIFMLYLHLNQAIPWVLKLVKP